MAQPTDDLARIKKHAEHVVAMTHDAVYHAIGAVKRARIAEAQACHLLEVVNAIQSGKEADGDK